MLNNYFFTDDGATKYSFHLISYNLNSENTFLILEIKVIIFLYIQ
jgi:hypothetical protein